MKILKVIQTTLEPPGSFKDFTKHKKFYTVQYATYGGIGYICELNEDEAMWVLEEDNLKYKNKFKDAFTDALREYIASEIND